MKRDYHFCTIMVRPVTQNGGIVISVSHRRCVDFLFLFASKWVPRMEIQGTGSECINYNTHGKHRYESGIVEYASGNRGRGRIDQDGKAAARH